MWAITIEVDYEEKPLGFPFLEDSISPLMFEDKEDAIKACELIARGYAGRVKFSETETIYNIHVVAKNLDDPNRGLIEVGYSVLGGKFLQDGIYRSQALKSEHYRRQR